MKTDTYNLCDSIKLSNYCAYECNFYLPYYCHIYGSNKYTLKCHIYEMYAKYFMCR